MRSLARSQVAARAGDVRQPLHRAHVKTLDTAALRRHFLVERLFVPDELALTYSQIDRIIVGGVMPVRPWKLRGVGTRGTAMLAMQQVGGQAA